MNPAFTVGENDEENSYTFNTSLMAIEKVATEETTEATTTAKEDK